MAREVRGPETGGAVPRAAQQGDTIGLAVGGLVLLAISPVGFVVAIVSVFAVLRQVRRHWWEIAAIAGVLSVAVVAVEQFTAGGFLSFHFGGYGEAIAGGSWIEAVLRTAPLGVPLGIAAGAVFVGISEAWTGAAEWHPLEQRRREVDQAKAESRIDALLAPIIHGTDRER